MNHSSWSCDVFSTADCWLDLARFLFGVRILSCISNSQEHVLDIGYKLSLEVLNLSGDLWSATFSWKPAFWGVMTLLRKRSHFRSMHFPSVLFLKERWALSWVGGETRGFVQVVVVTELVLALPVGGTHRAPGFRSPLALLEWVGTRSCAVSRLLTWLCQNPDEEFLENHSELDKQQLVTLALSLLFQTVVFMVRKAQVVERRWVRYSRPLLSWGRS